MRPRALIFVVPLVASCFFVAVSKAQLVHLPPSNANASAIQFQSSEEDGSSSSPAWASQLDASVARAVLDLGVRLQRATWPRPATNDDATVALSPLSVAVALAVTLLGARGETRAQLSAALLGDDAAAAAAPATLHHLGRQLALLEADASLASAVFVQRDLPLSRRFARLAQEAFHCSVQALDFKAGGGAEAAAAINAWVSGATRGKIPSLWSQPPPAETRLVVASALYFQGAWEKPFPKAMTQRKPFHAPGGETLEVSLMTNSADLPYLNDASLRCRLLGLPYVGGRVVMYLVLPDLDGDQPLKDLEANLTDAGLRRLVATANVTNVIVAIPRMTIETSLSLKDPLMALGVTALFDASRSDLSGLLEDPVTNSSSTSSNQTQASSALYVDAVLHKVRLEVTETGTVAAAVTALSISRDGSRPVFRADRPFLFFIHDRDTGLVLFSGRVTRPTPHTVLNATQV